MTPPSDDAGVFAGAENHGATAPCVLEGRGRYGRMFPFLPACDPGQTALEALAAAMEGAPLGPAAPPGTPGRIPAGYTYLGQFIGHDITFDPTSQLEKSNDPLTLADFRTPRLDLDSLYGSSPADQPYLYERTNAANRRVKLLVGSNPDGPVADLPRNGDEEVALIGDPRNDENLIIAQLHLLFIRFHNKVVEHLRGRPTQLTGGDLFREAQRIVRWHYQWIVVHDFLERVVGSETLTRHHGRPRYTCGGQPFIPVEFSGAAYRFGHSMVRDSYRLNETTRGLPIFPDGPDSGPLDHLGGFRRLRGELVIDWGFFFDIPGPAGLQFSDTIDRHIAFNLSKLPGALSPDQPSLPLLNLRRGRALGLPAGSDVARAMGEDPLTDICGGSLDEILPHDVDPIIRDALRLAPPLWYFVLVEAEKTSDGLHLGPVGGRIVAEVIHRLLEADPQSYLHAWPAWTPDADPLALTASLSRPPNGDFAMPDLVEFVEQNPR